MVSKYFFMDADHVGNRATRRYHNMVLILMNMAPILWYSNRHNTVNTNTFLREFITLKTATELVETLRYKLRMFGIPIEGLSNMFCDIESVYKNISTPDSTLKKKNGSIFCHKCREDVASGVD